jgi:hypothetical protein
MCVQVHVPVTLCVTVRASLPMCARARVCVRACVCVCVCVCASLDVRRTWVPVFLCVFCGCRGRQGAGEGGGEGY